MVASPTVKFPARQNREFLEGDEVIEKWIVPRVVELRHSLC
jgi:hypothetical protein